MGYLFRLQREVECGFVDCSWGLLVNYCTDGFTFRQKVLKYCFAVTDFTWVRRGLNSPKFYAKFNFSVINWFLMTNLLVVPQRGEDSWENTISCKFLKSYVVKMRIILRSYASKSSRILTRLLLIARGLSHIAFIRSYIRATNHSSRFAYVTRQCWKVSLAGGCLLPACGVKLTGARREGGSVFSFPPRVSCVFWMVNSVFWESIL